jgi:hypothetical protein
LANEGHTLLEAQLSLDRFLHQLASNLSCRSQLGSRLSPKQTIYAAVIFLASLRSVLLAKRCARMRWAAKRSETALSDSYKSFELSNVISFQGYANVMTAIGRCYHIDIQKLRPTGSFAALTSLDS